MPKITLHRLLRRCCTAVIVLSLTTPALAHKLAPSLLRLTELPDSSIQVFWKTPAIAQVGQNLQPVFPDGCQITQPPQRETAGTGIVWRWSIRCSEGLTGHTLAVNGMAESATATLVNIHWQDGRRVQQLLNASLPQFVVPEQQSRWQVMVEYTQLGIAHIWLGIDHLLFVLALLLLVPNTRLLIWTITSFTVGHSITLSLVALGFFDYPVSLVEFAIAASIFVLAIELVNARNGQPGSRRWIPGNSWLVAMAFGLLHGMGFAGALKAVGLPAGDIPMALLSFNIGIEIGQIIFVLLMLVVIRLGKRWSPAMAGPGWWTTVYSIGCLSAFWCIERGLSVFNFSVF